MRTTLLSGLVLGALPALASAHGPDLHVHVSLPGISVGFGHHYHYDGGFHGYWGPGCVGAYVPAYEYAPAYYAAPAPVYVAPAPVYVAPAPIYTAPPAVYSAPPAVYAAPAPLYVAPYYGAYYYGPGFRYNGPTVRYYYRHH